MSFFGVSAPIGVLSDGAMLPIGIPVPFWNRGNCRVGSSLLRPDGMLAERHSLLANRRIPSMLLTCFLSCSNFNGGSCPFLINGGVLMAERLVLSSLTDEFSGSQECDFCITGGRIKRPFDNNLGMVSVEI